MSAQPSLASDIRSLKLQPSLDEPRELRPEAELVRAALIERGLETPLIRKRFTTR